MYVHIVNSTLWLLNGFDFEVDTAGKKYLL